MQVSWQEQGSAVVAGAFSGHVIQVFGAGGHGRRLQGAAGRLHGSVEQEKIHPHSQGEAGWGLLPSLPFPGPAPAARREVHTHLKGAKASGQGTGASRAVCERGAGGGCRARGGAFPSLSLQQQETPLRRRSSRGTRGPQSSPWSWAGCRVSAPAPSHCHPQKRGRGCHSLGVLAGSLSHRAKRSLGIPVPPRIQIYTVPERRGREGGVGAGGTGEGGSTGKGKMHLV